MFGDRDKQNQEVEEAKAAQKKREEEAEKKAGEKIPAKYKPGLEPKTP